MKFKNPLLGLDLAKVLSPGARLRKVPVSRMVVGKTYHLSSGPDFHAIFVFGGFVDGMISSLAYIGQNTDSWMPLGGSVVGNLGDSSIVFRGVTEEQLELMREYQEFRACKDVEDSAAGITTNFSVRGVLSERGVELSPEDMSIGGTYLLQVGRGGVTGIELLVYAGIDSDGNVKAESYLCSGYHNASAYEGGHAGPMDGKLKAWVATERQLSLMRSMVAGELKFDYEVKNPALVGLELLARRNGSRLKDDAVLVTNSELIEVLSERGDLVPFGSLASGGIYLNEQAGSVAILRLSDVDYDAFTVTEDIFIGQGHQDLIPQSGTIEESDIYYHATGRQVALALRFAAGEIYFDLP